MTQEEKELLLQVICAMLPYGVKIFVKGHDTPQTIQGILSIVPNISFRTDDCYSVYLTDVKPYLRPMSSMTMEERYEYDKFINSNSIFNYRNAVNWVHWLNSNHFDYYGLIPMGLALEATEDMYTTK
jgi:hypothetical protein